MYLSFLSNLHINKLHMYTPMHAYQIVSFDLQKYNQQHKQYTFHKKVIFSGSFIFFAFIIFHEFTNMKGYNTFPGIQYGYPILWY